MASITFKPKAGATETTAVVETPVTSTEIVTRESHAPTVQSAAAPTNLDRSDIILPRVNLVQKSGKLCDDFQPGSFLLEKQAILAKPGADFTAVVLGTDKYYQEKVEYGSDEFGRRANSEGEVRQMGGTTTYGVADKPYFQNVADLLLAVKAPEGLPEDQLDLFPFPYEDGHYAVAVYTVAASAYTSLAKRIFTDSLYTLKAGLHLGEYKLKSELKRNAQNSWYIPTASMPRKYNDAAKAEFFESLKSL